MYSYDDFRNECADELLERFLRYVKIDTGSDESLAGEKTPSTDGQWDLLRLLADELREMGVGDVSLDEHGFLIARIPGNLPEGSLEECIGFMAHVDTNGDAPNKNVQPLVHESYNGKPIRLSNSVVINPTVDTLLEKYIGETLVTSDGTTLLGADDKAGVAEIMTAAAWFLGHPEFKRPTLELIFTPDEETGTGMNRFPLDKLRSKYCFTMDGSEEGELETECYYAFKAVIGFKGRAMHPGTARGRLVNATTMAGTFISMLPRNESPEATDGRFGNYWPHAVSGGLDAAELTVFYRSFSRNDIQRRGEALKTFAAAVEASFPGGEVQVDIKEQYRNMREKIDEHPQLIRRLRNAVRAMGIEPIEKPIRGGTDGARLTAMGIPTPNVFAGGVNFHSLSEWVALPAMIRAVGVVVKIAGEWAAAGKNPIDVG